MEISRELTDSQRQDEMLWARSLTPEQRLSMGGELFDEVCERMRIGIRNQFPDASEQRVKEILFERFEIIRRLERQS